MARDNYRDTKQEPLQVVSSQTERTSRACSLLFQSWMHLGSQIIVGSADAMATTLRDLNDLYCDPRGGVGREDTRRRDDDRRKD